MDIFQYKHFPFPVTRVILPNGLTVFIVKKESKITLAQINFAAGSLDDGNLPGTAHFLEHMLFEGPSHDGIHPKLRHLFIKGIDANASTCLADTEYWVKGFSENFRICFKLFSQLRLRPRFPKRQWIKNAGLFYRKSDKETTKRILCCGFIKLFIRIPHIFIALAPGRRNP